MNDPCRVRVTGPLAQFAAGFRTVLLEKGYAPGTAALQLQLLAQLSRWLDGHGLDVAELTAERVEQFFDERRARVRVLQVSPASLRLLLSYLDVLGVIPAAAPRPPAAPVELLVERYGRFLVHERGLGASTACRYLLVARRFLTACAGSDGSTDDVDAASVVAFMTAECEGKSGGWARCVATALRSLLRFLLLEGFIGVPLANSVPAPATWRAASLPTALTPTELAAVLAACNQRSPSGRRDYAVIVLGARLGLRAGEISGLELGDVDWASGVLRVRGKGGRIDPLPLPTDVGRALAAYVQQGRPPVPGVLFRHVHAPSGPLASATVTGIVYRACDRAGLPRVGAHRLRHTAATQMLRGGASLPEIAQVLRHRSPNTTAIYAKVDRLALAELARPWPCGVA